VFNCWSLVPRNIKWWPVRWYFLNTWRDLHSPQHYFFFCKITLLLRDNAHTMMFTLLKCTSQWSLVYLQILASILTNSRTFYQSKGKRCIHEAVASYHPYPCQSQIHFISVNLLVLGISFKWNHRTCGLLCLASFTYHHVYPYFIHVEQISVLHSFS